MFKDSGSSLPSRIDHIDPSWESHNITNVTFPAHKPYASSYASSQRCQGNILIVAIILTFNIVTLNIKSQQHTTTPFVVFWERWKYENESLKAWERGRGERFGDI